MFTETANHPRPTNEQMLARMHELGHQGYVVDDYDGGIISAYSYHAVSGTMGHPLVTLEWLPQRDADGTPQALGWYRESTPARR